MEEAREETPLFLDQLDTLDKESISKQSSKISKMFKELIKHGQDKVKLATVTYDIVEKHIKRLDADLAKFEEEQMTGPKLVSKVDYKYVVNEKPVRPRRSGDTPKKRKVEEEESPPTPQRTSSQRSAPPPKKTNPPRQRRPYLRLISEPQEVETEVIDDIDADPNEPTYCICDRVSFGEMIACDNDDCAREWFHYTCVGLTGPVKGKWFCPECTELMKQQ